jgi:transaldolase
MSSLPGHAIQIFADGANLASMQEAHRHGVVKGFTTNPTLMRRDGVGDYRQFAREVLRGIADVPVSFEVFADDFASMEREAREIAGWAPNVNVKIPVTNTRGEFSGPLIQRLSADGLFLNVTALMTLEQVRAVAAVLSPRSRTIVSVFAGRIADTGRDPEPIMRAAAKVLRPNRNAQLLWASAREVLNIFQAEAAGCHIITVTNDILKKLSLLGKDLSAISLDTVKMFYQDAQAAGYKL